MLKITLRKLDRHYNAISTLLDKSAKDGDLNYNMGRTLDAINEAVEGMKRTLKRINRDHCIRIPVADGATSRQFPKLGHEDEYEDAVEAYLDQPIEIWGKQYKASMIKKELSPTPAEWAAVLGWWVEDDLAKETPKEESAAAAA